MKGGFLYVQKKSKTWCCLAAGAGVAAVLAKNSKCNPVTSKAPNKSASSKNSVNSDYRNTERGKYEKNSKGIYYTNGNYEAFARPEKPKALMTNMHTS